MGRNKTQKFQDNDERDNVVQAGKPIYEQIKGKWKQDYFQNDGDLVLELACGRGEYTVGLAPHFPEKNFIGIDIKGARIWKGSGIAIEQNLTNVAFLRTHIQNISEFFAEGEVSEIWIIHPDPRPKDSDERRRLTNNRFLDIYKSITRKDGLIRLKTDDSDLFHYTMDVLNERKDIRIIDVTDDLYNDHQLNQEHFGITTRYESEFVAKGRTIKYVKFSFTNQES